MYLVYSIHPKSFKVTARSVHQDHEMAVKALVQQSYDYITKYRGHKDLKKAKSLEEIEKTEGPGFFYIITDEYDDRLTIYEKKTVSAAGYVYNAQYEIVPYLIFSMTVLPQIPGCQKDAEISTLIAPRHVEKLENIKPDIVQKVHSNYMTELHALLQKRGPVESESSQNTQVEETKSELKEINAEILDALEEIEQKSE